MNNLLKNKAIVDFLVKAPVIKKLFFTGLGMALLGFLFLSLLSYNANDPTWSHVSNTSTTTNIAGRLGAWVSDILRVFFGLGSWWITIAIGYELLGVWWKYDKPNWQLRFISYAFLLIFISALLTGWGAKMGNTSALWSGGVIGLELYQGLVSIFGAVASTVFLVTLIVLVATLTLGIEWQKLFGFGKKSTPTPIAPTPTPVPDGDPEPAQDPALFDLVSPTKSPTPTPSAVHGESLGAFLQNSGLRDKVLSEREAKKHTATGEGNYTDNHGMGVTTVPANVKIQHQATESPKKPEIFIYEPPQIEPDGIPAAEPVVQPEPAIQPIAKPIAKQSNEQPAPQQAPIAPPVQTVSEPVLTQRATYPEPSEPVKPVFVPEPQVYQEPTPAYVDSTPATPEVAPIAQQTQQTDLFEAFNPAKPKSHAMSTLEYRMSLTPVPELSLLDPPNAKQVVYSPEELSQLSELLAIKLQEFNISATVVSAMVGPVVTRFEVELAAGVKVSRVTKVAQDLARSMSMTSLRVLPVIAGKPYIGIEVPNRHRNIVSLIELLDTPAYQDPESGISIAIGADISGKPVIADLAKAPHMLVAGTTGSGKSVLVNSFLLSMLLKYTPDELKLVLIDPKQLELANYADIPHLLTPVITDMTEATAALNWCVNEMERRYKLIGLLRVRQLSEFNKKVRQAEAMGEPLLDPLWNAADHVGSSIPRLKPLPKIVVVADEFADMIMQLGKTAEEPIVRLAQKARAAGIHLILATQRPVASVVTGLIKSNVPSRVALRVNSAIDSRLIIEESGAENMLGHGDMMFLAPGKNETERVHGAYVKDDEVNRVTDAWRERGVPDYIDLSNSYSFEGEGSGNANAVSGGDDEYYNQAVAFFVETQKVSISSLQRKMSIGYNKAARLVDLMEERGVVSSPDAGGKRQLLI